MDYRVCGYWGSILCCVELSTYAYLFNDTFLFFLDQHGVLPQDNSTLGTPSEMGGSYPNSSGSASMDIDVLNAIIIGNAAPFSNSSVKNLIVQSVEQAISENALIALLALSHMSRAASRSLPIPFPLNLGVTNRE